MAGSFRPAMYCRASDKLYSTERMDPLVPSLDRRSVWVRFGCARVCKVSERWYAMGHKYGHQSSMKSLAFQIRINACRYPCKIYENTAEDGSRPGSRRPAKDDIIMFATSWEMMVAAGTAEWTGRMDFLPPISFLIYPSPTLRPRAYPVTPSETGCYVIGIGRKPLG